MLRPGTPAKSGLFEVWGQKRGQIRPERLFPPTSSLLDLLPTVPTPPSSAPIPSSFLFQLVLHSDLCASRGTTPAQSLQRLPSASAQARPLSLPFQAHCPAHFSNFLPQHVSMSSSPA